MTPVEHPCAEPGCLAPGLFGEGVFLRRGEFGTWRCLAHERARRETLLAAVEELDLTPVASPPQGFLDLPQIRVAPESRAPIAEQA